MLLALQGKVAGVQVEPRFLHPPQACACAKVKPHEDPGAPLPTPGQPYPAKKLNAGTLDHVEQFMEL